MRVGIGFDAHPFLPGRKLFLGGIELSYPLGLAGHSDADVALHALMDALLGAAALPEIGHFFPDTDDRWRNASSVELLKQVVREVSLAGFQIVNVDLVIIAEEPYLAPYREEMRRSIARTLGVETGKVGVKATTTEKLGFVGRKEGIAAQAVVLLQEKDEAKG